jgi:leucyl-tRNA synthetase
VPTRSGSTRCRWGPLDVSRPWETRAVVGAQRFLQRVWRIAVDERTGELVVTDDELDETTLRALHRAIAGVRTDMDGMRLNTAVAKLIEYSNHLTKVGCRARAAVEPLVLMMAPLAPHVAEELWSRLGHEQTLAYEPFPVADPAYLVEDTVTAVVQVQGKVRAKLEVAPDISESDLEAAGAGRRGRAAGDRRTRRAQGDRAGPEAGQRGRVGRGRH